MGTYFIGTYFMKKNFGQMNFMNRNIMIVYIKAMNINHKFKKFFQKNQLANKIWLEMSQFSTSLVLIYIFFGNVAILAKNLNQTSDYCNLDTVMVGHQNLQEMSQTILDEVKGKI